ncbi:hypothetical protein AVEN_124859-1 [Araneus ventricosus]|uniref:Uncharacterized protein n=1 Tax=Araneus ventricosus TaxID=182803 RepID=A0A4Y2RBC5_ARAVE|nr:hypothetical protein AVEN_124859-1 [Araneus ventricosus]
MKFAKLLDKDPGTQKAAGVLKNHHAGTREVGAAVQNNFNLATLPPAEEAAQLHSWRVFLQVNLWTGLVLEPLNGVVMGQSMGCSLSQ